MTLSNHIKFSKGRNGFRFCLQTTDKVKSVVIFLCKTSVKSIENLVPEDHLLRKIDKYIDFSFINEILKPAENSAGLSVI
jgi:hypothetical protein